jgi:hypothetical protein
LLFVRLFCYLRFRRFQQELIATTCPLSKTCHPEHIRQGYAKDLSAKREQGENSRSSRNNDGGRVNRMVNFDADDGTITETRLAVRVGTCAFPAQVGSGGKYSYFPLRGVKWQTKKQS